MSPHQMAQLIDLAILKPELTRQDILEGCQQAKSCQLKSLVVLPCWLGLIIQELGGSTILPSTVIAFPFGAEDTEVKVTAARAAAKAGALELDMVMAIGKLKSGDLDHVRQDIAAVVEAAKSVDQKILIKVILETCLLTNDEKRIAAKLSEEAGADFVKTSTGFSSTGATIDDVRLLRKTVSERVGIKASGGIRNWEQALAFIEAGANRLGTSNAKTILNI